MLMLIALILRNEKRQLWKSSDWSIKIKIKFLYLKIKISNKYVCYFIWMEIYFVYSFDAFVKWSIEVKILS